MAETMFEFVEGGRAKCSSCPYYEADDDGDYVCNVTFDYKGCHFHKKDEGEMTSAGLERVCG